MFKAVWILLILFVGSTVDGKKALSVRSCPVTTGSSDEVDLATSPNSGDKQRKELHVSLNCTFRLQQKSKLTTPISLILSRSTAKGYSVIAAVTVASEDVVVKDSLGGQVTGKMVADGLSYITYTWISPTDNVNGKFQCEAYGINEFGQPSVATKSKVITIQPLDHNVLVAEYVKLEQKLQALTEANDAVLDRHKKQLQICEMASVRRQYGLERSLVYQNSTYFLSGQHPIDAPEFDGVCQRIGGYLAELDDEYEWEALDNFVSDSTSDWVLIGGQMQRNPREYVYKRSGATVKYLDWKSGQPNDGVGGCLMLCGSQTCDYDCEGSSSDYRFLCEIPTPI